MKYGHIVDNSEIIDEVLVTYFKKPKSYTTEDMCEINTHGGNIVTRKILELCLKNGANLAEPGEFTKRAFLNGRIDLLQAESVIDVINAKSEREAKTGIKQLEGILSKKINEIKQEILDVMVNVDVSIDYPEYDVEEVTYQEISNMLTSVKEKLEKLEKSFDNGKLIKEGIKTAIIGKPNAGKSSLLNAILKEDRAIVTEYEGTTRDTIEEFVNIEGIPLKLIDTAGIRNAKDEVEKIGIAKSREIAKEADLIIAIFDSTKELSPEDLEILNLIKGKKSIVILNKIDLEQKLDEKYMEVIDIMKRDDLAILNTIATAEGTIEVAIKNTDKILQGSRVLILGFGRVGKIVANKFSKMSAIVTCAARKVSDLAWIKAYGYNSLNINDMLYDLKEFDIIINTVPQTILRERELKHIDAEALLIDLASSPGGIDGKIAKSMGLNFIWALALPGRIAPSSSAKFIKDTVYTILEEMSKRVE